MLVKLAFTGWVIYIDIILLYTEKAMITLVRTSWSCQVPPAGHSPGTRLYSHQVLHPLQGVELGGLISKL